MKKEKGITLIALIITIIIMLILVAVSISVALNTGLFKSASDATKNWKTAQEEESKMQIEIGGKKYDSIEDYLNGVERVEPENIADWDYDIEADNTITIKEYLNTDKTIDTIIIPNYIGGLPVKKILPEGKPIWNVDICEGKHYVQNSIATFSNDTVKKIIISPGIQIIGFDTFANTTRLAEITIPNSITSIGGFAFSFCGELTEITIPNSVTNIEDSAFNMCKGLTKILIPNSVTSIGEGAFQWCKRLTDITIPSNVITMGEGVFYNIPSITVHVPWKKGEKPDGWADAWNSTPSNCKIEVVYTE